MAKVVIVVTKVGNQVETLSAVRRYDPALSFSDVKGRIAASAPVVEIDLSQGAPYDHAERARVLIRDLIAAGAEIRLFQMRSAEPFDWNGDVKIWERSVEVLLNFLSQIANYE